MLLVFCAREHSLATCYDIIPEAWVTGDGSSSDTPAPAGDRTLILPSDRGGDPVSHDANGFLSRNNGIPIGTGTFCFPCEHQSICRITVTRSRDSRTRYNLVISADADSIAAIHSLDWDQFRNLQHRLSCWLLDRSTPPIVGNLFDKPHDRFYGFEGQLRSFWHCCLENSGFKSYLDKHLEDYFPQPAARLPDANQSAPWDKMGATCLRPGERLAIHWGGIANYGFGLGNITRQTMAGVTYLSVVDKNGITQLAPSVGGTIIGFSPVVVQAGSVPNPVAYPFGQKTLEYVANLVPVYNQFDLNNHRLFAPAPSSKKLSLFLLTPAEYVEPDGGVNEKGDLVFSPYNTGDVGSADIKVDTGPVKGNFYKTLYRHFIIWADENRKADDFKNFDLQKACAHSPAVFGNQTWIDIEVPVSINGGEIEWIARNTSCVDFLRLHALGSLDSEPRCDTGPPIFRLAHALPCNSGSSTLHVIIFRFWTLPEVGLLDKIELQPTDSFALAL
jgi:hypothetical protein